MAKSKYDVSSLYDSNRRRKEEEGERNIQSRMRSNSNNPTSSNANWRDTYEKNKNKNYEDNERNIQNQMRSNSYHDRELVKKDRDEANIRNQMRKNRANTTNNPAYQAYDKHRRSGEQKARAIANTLKNVGDSIGRKGGIMDREWKNHKWISRERNDAGKWIYDYGDSGSSKRGSSKPVLKTRIAKRGVDSENLPKQKNDFEKAVDNAGKTLNDIGSNAAKLASEVGDSVNKTISDITTNAAVIRDLGKVFIDNTFR